MKRDTIKKLKEILGKRTFTFYILIFLGVLQSVLSVGLALSIKTLVNAYEKGGLQNEIISASAILFIIVFLIFIVGVSYKIISSKYTANIEQKLKNQVFKSFIGGSYGEISQNNSGEVISKFSVDALRVANIYSNLPSSIISTLSHIVAVLIALFILQPTFTFIVVVCGIVALIITFLVRKVLVKYYKKVRKSDGKISSFIGESTKNSLVVKAFNAEDFISINFNKMNSIYKRNRLKHAYLGALLTSITSFAFTLFYAFGVLYGLGGMINGVESINFGVIIAVLQLITQIKTPINNLTSYIAVYTEMHVSAERLFTLINGKGEEKLTYNGDFSRIEISGVSYSYGDKEVLSSCNLEINKGDKILIKGVSGEGKSTFLKLLMGLYTPTDGKIDINLKGERVSPEKIKGVFSFVPQDNMLFLGSVKENITFNKDYDIKEIQSVLDLALVDFIPNTESGLNLVIGENGLNLSIGQGQRIALARGLIKGSPVLVLDEATSSLDESTEEEILKRLSKLDDLTIVFVSHRFNFEKYANKVYNLSGGKLSLVARNNSKDENS